MFPRSPSPDTVERLSGLLQRLERDVWLDGCWRGVVSTALLFLLLALCWLLFRNR